MKKLIFLSFISFILLGACHESKSVVSKEEIMRGDWIITNVSFDGVNPAHIDTRVFNGLDPKCFTGSSWHLVQNNNSGNYTINGSGNCPSGTSNLKWFVTDEGGTMFFNFKIIDEGEKAKQQTTGYKLRITNTSESFMVLRQDLMFEGKPIGINYTFSKN